MNTQPEALRLADALERDKWHVPAVVMQAAADELRRLHGLDFALRNCELALQKMATKYMDAVDQRDALLELLEEAQGCFITQDITRQEYERLYPDAEEETK